MGYRPDDFWYGHRPEPPRGLRDAAKKFEYVEKEPEITHQEEPGLTAFLQNASLRGDATAEEIEFLRKLRFNGKRPTALYYYREIQNLRDPLHFQAS